MPTSSQLPLRLTTAVAAVAVVLAPAALAVPAHADASPSATGSKKPKPPAHMSTVGGERLGRTGTQVEPKPGADAPELPKGLSARSWIVSDAESGEVLASHNAHWQLPPASTLKMLFADTVLPKLPKSKEHKVERSDLDGMGEGSSLVGVKVGQTYKVEDLWRGVFLRSGNDAVHVLAAMNGGVDETVREMNARAHELHANDTNVVTPDGYDEPGQHSSAYDLTLFARKGLQNADFRDYASTARAQFPGAKKKGKKRPSFQIQNTNRLLTGDVGIDPYPGIAGVKNGSTTNAGTTFTGVAQHGDRVLLVTCMHPDKQEPFEVYKETEKLFDWGFDAAGKVEPVGVLVPPGEQSRAKDGQAGGAGGAHKNGSGQAGGAAAAEHTAQDGSSSGGAGVALGVTAGSLALLAAVAFAVHRLWPLPDLVRRRRRRSPGAGPSGE